MNIGANLYGLGYDASLYFEKTAKKFHAYGYQRVEPLVMFAGDQKEMEGKPFVPLSIWQQDEVVERGKWLKERHGIMVESCHMGGLPGEDFSKKLGDMIDLIKTSDVREFVMSRLLSSKEECIKDAVIFNQVADALKPYGGRILYHNHEVELRKILVDDKEEMVIDYFLSLCPDVMLEADLGWVMFAGEDEVAFLKNHMDRISFLHLKDFKKGFAKDRREKDIVCVGEGVLDLQAIVSFVKGTRLEDRLIIDQDCSTGDLLDDYRRGILHVKECFCKHS